MGKKKKRYTARVLFESSVYVDVEAANEDEARELFMDSKNWLDEGITQHHDVLDIIEGPHEENES